MPDWTDLAADTEVPEGGRLCVDANGLAVLLIREGGPLRAIANLCPHAMLPLESGEVCGNAITCPHHGLRYDLASGQNLDDPANETPVMAFETRVKDGRIQAHISDEQRRRAATFTPPPRFR